MAAIDQPNPTPEELRCPRCFARDVVPSQNRGLRDMLMAQLGRVPRHCRFCGKRFYAVPGARRATVPGETPTDGSKVR